MKSWIIGAITILLLGGVVWKLTAKPESKLQSDKVTEQQSKLEITDKDWVRGRKEAPVMIVEYGDFQCPSCGAYYPVLKQLEEDYGEELAVVWREYPLTTIHVNAWGAAVAAEAAGKQGKFWEMHDALFENQKEWTETGKFDGYAQKIALDIDRWKQDMKEVEGKIRADQNSGIDLGVTGTPTFFINGQKIRLPGGLEEFKALIDGIKVAEGQNDKVHMHFDIAVDIGGKKVDLSGDEYMEKNEAVHLHDNNGEVAHIHKKGATLGMFIDSLGLVPGLDPRVNGEVVGYWRDYQPQDLDRIVFGNGPVTDGACIYSEKCPERGTPPPEEGCVGGLDTPCE